jgi:hypothetical protein
MSTGAAVPWWRKIFKNLGRDSDHGVRGLNQQIPFDAREDLRGSPRGGARTATEVKHSLRSETREAAFDFIKNSEIARINTRDAVGHVGHSLVLVVLDRRNIDLDTRHVGFRHQSLSFIVISIEHQVSLDKEPLA